MKRFNAAYILFALLVLSSPIARATQAVEGSSVHLPDVNDIRAVAVHMQALLDRGLDDPEWPADIRREDIVVYDLTLLYSYSVKDGLKRLTSQPGIDIERDKSSEERDANADGTPANPLSGNNVPAFITTTITAKRYGPFRRVKSLDNGYTKVYAYITLPGSSELYGLDGVDAYGVQLNEGAFDYFRLTNGNWDMECGLCTQHHMIDDDPDYRYNDAGRWYVYRSHPSGQPRAWLSMHDRPTGGFAPGSTVFMKMWVPADDQVKTYYACSGYNNLGEIYYDWMTGPKVNGSGNRFRRTTSMVFGGKAKSMNNVWSDIYIYNSSEGDHYWTSDDTIAAGAENGDAFGGGVAANWVTPHDTVVRYNETVSIKTPTTKAKKK